MPDAKPVDTIAAATATWLKNRILGFLFIVFLLTQLYVLGVLPALKNTMNVLLTTQKNIIANAQAEAAAMRSKAEADTPTQEAAINAEKAKYAERRTAAQARITAAEAAQKLAMATNSTVVQEATKDVAEQEARIKEQLALNEQRKASALALKAQNEAKKLEVKQHIANTLVHYSANLKKVDAMAQCMLAMENRTAARDLGMGGDLPLPALGARNGGFAGDERVRGILWNACVTPILGAEEPVTPSVTLDLPYYCWTSWYDFVTTPLKAGEYRSFAVGQMRTGTRCGSTLAHPTQAEADAEGIADCQKRAANCQIAARKHQN